MKNESWVGLESNPAVMTQYAQKLGVSDRWSFSDCWGLDSDALKHEPAPCVGCIFLYPFSQVEARKRALGARRGCEVPGVWHMKQLVGNACGAVAIMHTVMNTLDRVGAGAKSFPRSCALEALVFWPNSFKKPASLPTRSSVFITVCMIATAPHALPTSCLMCHTPATSQPRRVPSARLRASTCENG